MDIIETADIAARSDKVTSQRNSLVGWLIVEDCDDGSIIVESHTGDRKRVWPPETDPRHE